MKRTFAILIISLAMSVFSMNVFAAGKRVFGEVSKLPGVESVYIGPAALRLASSAILSENLGDGISGAIKDLKGIEVIDCSNKKSFGKLEKFADSLVERMNLEIIIDSQDGDEMTSIYGAVPENSKDVDTIHALFIVTHDKTSFNLVYISGTIDLAALEEMTGGGSKSKSAANDTDEEDESDDENNETQE